jgi:hypothetical protein
MVAVVMIAGLAIPGCRQDMHDQPNYSALEASSFFADGRASRAPVPGTVARGQLHEDDHLYRGKIDGARAKTFPFPITMAVMERGRDRYDIFCAPCHDRLGTGAGIVVRRGLSQPPSFHVDRLRTVEPGYLFDVIGTGFGRMNGYAAQVKPEDRWAIVAYIRALQLSQAGSVADVPPAERGGLDTPPAGPASEERH